MTLKFRHSAGVFEHPRPLQLTKDRPHLLISKTDPDRHYFNLTLPSGEVVSFDFDSADEAMEAERLAENAINPEPQYSSFAW